MNAAANLSGKSLNAWVTDQLQSAVARAGVKPTAKAQTAKKIGNRKSDKARKPRSLL